ncbi:SDR family oxidoreductase [Methylobacterium sp. E-005]|uniref:SDR family NAD(P)-dependent oxidoreductase n=1 Tax=Methylobacterium sp. E-005 TaxID=2836549 RepID=UPI001FBA7B5F|nr:SDR family oxidoreductase [Methylobacterium sp. E-005]MCJ2087638.1 SDR family oxidoreductase [Methylobacterium sp. E-005]
MDLQLAGKTCLVTGASSGIGYATALTLAVEGARVVAAARSLEALSPLSTVVTAATGRAPILIAADLSRDDGPGSLVAQVLEATGGVDVLVNNAGGSRPSEGEIDEAMWAEAYALNFLAALRLTERLALGMRARRWGRIVNLTGAIVAKAPNAATPAKAALESWSKAIAARYAPDGVTVNCVAPGRIDSAQIRDRLHPTEASRQAFIAQNIPAGRFGTPEEAAALIAFLASGPASYVNGATIPVDGGALRLAF